MSKTKSGFVACMVAVMLGVITFAAYKLNKPAFITLVSVFSAVGFLTVANLFWNWLQIEPAKKESALLPASSNFKFSLDCDDLATENEKLVEDFEATFDSIKREVGAE